MTFKIFIEETDTGGSPIWMESQDVNVVDGIYAVKLGAVTPLDSSLFEDPGRDYWLEVTVGTETLSPRQRLTSVPFALNAATLDGYTATELDQSVHVSRTDNPHQVTAAQIGATTLADLTWGNLSGIPADIADGDNDSGGDITGVTAGTGLSGGGETGSVTMSVNTSAIQQRVSGACAAGSSIRTVNADGTVVCETDDTGITSETDPQVGAISQGYVPRWNNSALVSGAIFDNGSQIGIGTSTPAEKLDITGNVRIRSEEPFLILEDKHNDGTRPMIRFLNNTGNFDSDDRSDQNYNFYSTFSSIRAHDAKIAVYGKTEGSWGKYLAITHDGTDGEITTDTGALKLSPASGEVIINGGVIRSGAITLIHTFGFDNFFAGENAGNLTTTGDSNTASGSYALYRNTTGNLNTASGRSALLSNSTGTSNTASGFHAGNANTTGFKNTFIGASSDAAANNLNNATALGYGAIVSGSNRVRIGNTSVTQIGGQVAWSNLSDMRVKKDISDIGLGLDFITALRPVQFRMLEGNDRLDFGFIAQDIESLLGEDYNILGIDGDPERTLSLRYTDFIAPMVKAMQEQQGQIEEQKEIITELRSEIDAIKVEIKAIKAGR